MAQITLEIPEYYNRKLELRAKKRQKTLQEMILEVIQKIVQDEEKNAEQDSSDAFDVLDRLTGSVEAPYDWAANHDYYLYGVSPNNKQKV